MQTTPIEQHLVTLGISSARAQAIVAAGYNTPERINAAKEDELAAIPGVGPTAAAAVVRALREQPAARRR
jgi:DNA uptake protein ComE-like DNA-binding protein